ncbi:hypothetical protein ACFX13_047963 [Malus domestica]
MLMVVINLMISLEMENLVTRNSGKSRRKGLMQMILYGQVVKTKANEHSDLIDADDSDELRSVWSGNDEEKSLWIRSEDDDDDDIPTEAYPNESSDKHIDKLFKFEETSQYRTVSELLKAKQEPDELSPGKQARKIAVENALKKLKNGQTGVILTCGRS